MSHIQEDCSILELTDFKFSPITSCDVERSFSIYKSIPTYRRQHFSFDNLKLDFIPHCNSELLK